MPAVDAQQDSKITFYALINEEYSIGVGIDRCQSALEHVLSFCYVLSLYYVLSLWFGNRYRNLYASS